MKTIAILLALVAAAQAISFIDLVREEWDIFKMQFAKKYDSEIEERYRMKIYMDNKHKIYEHNKEYQQGTVSFKMEMNHFGDLLHHEFIEQMNGYRRNMTRLEGYNDALFYVEPYNVTVPDTVDWRKEGAVTPVKNQGKCGSCWAFSTTGSLEGQHFRKIGQLVSLSEQNLMDCSHEYGNNGCEGGLMDNAFRYIAENHGIDTEGSYPYEARDAKCRYNPAKSGATDKNFVDIPEGNEDKLKIAVATVGPVSVAIDASHASFQFYSSGVYHEKKCSSTELDHGVLVVGYGTERGNDYWLVKNSWATSWGDEGYIKMARNKKNMCGIASDASYPVV